MNELKEFFVMGVVEGQQCSVIGRCGDVPIRVGDVFRSRYKYPSTQSTAEYASNAHPEECQSDVDMKVELIRAYGRELDHLSPGMTATLVLSGSGGSVLGPSWVLGSTSPCEIAGTRTPQEAKVDLQH